MHYVTMQVSIALLSCVTEFFGVMRMVLFLVSSFLHEDQLLFFVKEGQLVLDVEFGLL